jgi:hypothetical protein
MSSALLLSPLTLLLLLPLLPGEYPPSDIITAP